MDAAGPAPEAAIPAGARLHYLVEDANLRISTPVDWTSATGFDGALVVFTAPHPPGTPFVSNLTIVARSRDRGGEEDAVTAQAQALMQLGDALLLESSETAVGGHPAAWAVVACNDGEYELTVEQWIIARREKVVAITATVLTFDYALDADLYEVVVDSAVWDD